MSVTSKYLTVQHRQLPVASESLKIERKKTIVVVVVEVGRSNDIIDLQEKIRYWLKALD